MIDAAFVDEGFLVCVNGKRETVRGVVITASMDTPAKAEAQHFMHHNGNFGCPFCLNPGENVSTETKKKSTVHVYPCKEYPLRTREGTIENVRDALKSEKPVSFLFLSSFFFLFFLFFSLLFILIFFFFEKKLFSSSFSSALQVQGVKSASIFLLFPMFCFIWGSQRTTCTLSVLVSQRS